MKSLPIVQDGKCFKIMDGLVVVASGEIQNYHGYWTLVSGVVKKEYRGRGFQRRLIRARVKEAFKRGATEVRAWVKISNPHSMNNLISEGFRFVKVKKHKFEDGYYVCLILSNPRQ